MLTTRQIGNIGEDFTVEFLKSKGCEILDRNFTIKGGEIDIVAKKGNLVHFVEVKSRKKDPLTSASSAITQKKINLIVKTAREYYIRKDLDCNCIFDIALVEVDNGVVTDFSYIQRAFTADSK